MTKLFATLEEYRTNNDTDDNDTLRTEVELHEVEDQLNNNTIGTEQISDAIIDAGNQIETLEKLYTTLESFKDTGIDSQTAQLLQVSVETIGMSLGDKNFITLPSLESFESANNRITATEIALETIGEKIMSGLKAMWEALKAFFKRIYEFIQDLVDQYIPLIKKSAKKTYDRLNKFDKNAKSRPFKDANLAKGFGLPGDSSISLVDVEKMISIYNSAFNLIITTYNKIYSVIVSNKAENITNNLKTIGDEDTLKHVNSLNTITEKIIEFKLHLYNGYTFVEGDIIDIDGYKLKNIKIEDMWASKEGKADNITFNPATIHELMGLTSYVEKNYDLVYLHKYSLIAFKNIDKILSNALSKRFKNKSIPETAKISMKAYIKELHILGNFTSVIAKGYIGCLRGALIYINKCGTEAEPLKLT